MVYNRIIYTEAQAYQISIRFYHAASHSDRNIIQTSSITFPIYKSSKLKQCNVVSIAKAAYTMSAADIKETRCPNFVKQELY